MRNLKRSLEAPGRRLTRTRQRPKNARSAIQFCAILIVDWQVEGYAVKGS